VERNDVALVVVAGGRGQRLGAALPKAFVPLAGMPIVIRTLRACAQVGVFREATVAVPGEHVELFDGLVAAHAPWPFPVRGIAGGADRQGSVGRCLDALAGNAGIVVVHDGARPFASSALFNSCVESARAHGTGVAAVRVPDTLKRTDDGCVVGTVDRGRLWMAQTPQAFRLSLLRDAHRRAIETEYRGTDDAALVEWAGGQVVVVAGEPENIKITEPGDLRHAERLVAAGVGA
jgi:2-C-methyl-D-erythritol 4-phosphate cytidylyltransferase